jgi:DNA-directed RNA polymerase subunit RPC12/RpoP
VEDQVRCKLCGATPEGDAEFAMKHFQHRQLEKAGQAKGPMVYVCPRCSGRTTYEAKRETGQIR